LINRTIFRHTLKSNLKLWILFAAVTSLIMAIFVAVFKPSTISGVMDLIKDSALAGIVINTTFLGMLSSTFYTMHGVLLPLVYIIFTANGLIAAQVDRGSMAYVLSAPVRRSTLVLTQGLYLIVALAGMCTVITLVGLAAIRLFQSDIEVDVADFLLVNLGLLLLLFATSGISFLFSCVFNLSRHSVALGAGIPIAFFLFDLMSSVSEDLEFFKYFTINTLFDRDAILAGESVLLPFAVLAVIGVVLYGIGVRVFTKKDLPL